MQQTPRTRRLTRILAAVVTAAAFLVVTGSASGADTGAEPTVSAHDQPQISSGARGARGAEKQRAVKVPPLEYDESQLPRRMRQMATERWYESGVDMGQTIDCAFGTPAMLGRSWVGWYGDLGNTPTTNQPVYYTKIGWGVSGGCGGSYVAIEEFLPPGTQLAISQENPVVCWYDGLRDSELKRFTGNCPQQAKTGQQGGLAFNNPAVGAWETAIGTMLEIWIPVKSTQPLNGLDGNPCKSCLQAALWFIDGVSSPWGYPKIPVYVKGNAPTNPTVGYPAPSVRNTSCCNAGPQNNSAQGDIAAWFFTTGKTGTTEFQIGDQAGGPYNLYTANGTITQTDLNTFGQDIEQWLTLFFDPDTQYFWRACFTPDGGTKTCGREQSFNVPSPPDTTPPQTTITKQPAVDSESRSATFDFSSNKEFSTFKCRLDAGAWEGCAGPKSYTDLGDGQHTFEVQAISQAGVADSTPASYTWTVNPAPDTTITSKPAAKTKKRTATFTFTASEATKSFKCRLDDGKWKDCSSGSISYAKLSRTRHTFAVRATDLSGKVDKTPAQHTWKITR